MKEEICIMIRNTLRDERDALLAALKAARQFIYGGQFPLGWNLTRIDEVLEAVHVEQAERESRLASAEDIHALADRLHESGLHKASVHARSLAHELERKSSETP